MLKQILLFALVGVACFFGGVYLFSPTLLTSLVTNASTWLSNTFMPIVSFVQNNMWVTGVLTAIIGGISTIALKLYSTKKQAEQIADIAEQRAQETSKTAVGALTQLETVKTEATQKLSETQTLVTDAQKAALEWETKFKRTQELLTQMTTERNMLEKEVKDLKDRLEKLVNPPVL